MSEPLDLAIIGGRVVSSSTTRRLDVGIREGKIVRCGALADAPARERIDADQLLVLPGLVDEHVHPLYLDDIRHCSVVGLHGGVTTLMHFAYARPGESLLESVATLRAEGERESLTDFTVHAGMFDAAVQVDEMPAVAATGVRTFKIFLAYAAEGWMTDDAAFVRVLRAARLVDGLVLVHCENGAAIDVLEADVRAGRLGDDPVAALGASRPAVLEAEAIHRAAALGEALEVPVFIVHVTSARALEVVAAARARRAALVAETCPHYLTLTEEEVRRRGALAKIGPPLRSAADTAALWRGLADGTIQTIGSDHVPKKHADEGGADLLSAGFGAPALESMLAVVYDAGVAAGRITVERLVAVMAENPARVFGLWPRKGCVVEGADADLVLWDPHARRTLRATDGHSRSGYTLYEGREVRGDARIVIAGGRVRVREGALVDESPTGRFLPTGPFDMLNGR